MKKEENFCDFLTVLHLRKVQGKWQQISSPEVITEEFYVEDETQVGVCYANLPNHNLKF